jgi:hypothetical protein
MASYLYGRDVVADAKDTFSSWDKCMDKAYCKYVVKQSTAWETF